MTFASLRAAALTVAATGSLALCSPSAAVPSSALLPRSGEAATAAIPAQVGIYLGYGRPYRPYYGPYDRPYYRPYYQPYRYYAPPLPPPPPVTYYETRPYVARPARPAADPDAVARCASRFRSFNVDTGTYITYDGEERLCPYLR
jgi:hypothetical protein